MTQIVAALFRSRNVPIAVLVAGKSNYMSTYSVLTQQTQFG
jgi:hypothetical protein